VQIRKSFERGHVNHGWLDSYHSFSFASYYDPEWMGYSALRVINEDMVAPSKGFGTHSHQDMEIITYMVSGELTHKDSLGNEESLSAGDGFCEVQRMSAGSGVQHSEFNASIKTPVHFLQIWIEPNQLDLPPSYEDQVFTESQKLNQWCLIASDESHEGVLKVHQNIALFATLLVKQKTLEYALKLDRSVYLHVVKGEIEINQVKLSTGDAAIFENCEAITVKALQLAELLLFDLPKEI
jgi:redox-sensitive bicupin YhaK (pirin superfamily)